jgi:hypothetical protein
MKATIDFPKLREFNSAIHEDPTLAYLVAQKNHTLGEETDFQSERDVRPLFLHI